MSFHAGGTAAGQTDILSIVLSDVFQLSQCAAGQQFGCISSDVATSLIFGLFLPHVVLLVYLYIITRGPQMFQEHSGLGTLFGLGVYVFLVFQGWYAFLAQWFVWWLALTVIFSLGYFFLTKIFHPAETGARFKLAEQLGKKFTGGREKQKALRKFRREEERVEDKIDDLRSSGASGEEIAKWTDYLQQIREKILELED